MVLDEISLWSLMMGDNVFRISGQLRAINFSLEVWEIMRHHDLKRRILIIQNYEESKVRLIFDRACRKLDYQNLKGWLDHKHQSSLPTSTRHIEFITVIKLLSFKRKLDDTIFDDLKIILVNLMLRRSILRYSQLGRWKM